MKWKNTPKIIIFTQELYYVTACPNDFAVFQYLWPLFFAVLGIWLCFNRYIPAGTKQEYFRKSDIISMPFWFNQTKEAVKDIINHQGCNEHFCKAAKYCIKFQFQFAFFWITLNNSKENVLHFFRPLKFSFKSIISITCFQTY